MVSKKYIDYRVEGGDRQLIFQLIFFISGFKVAATF